MTLKPTATCLDDLKEFCVRQGIYLTSHSDGNQKGIWLPQWKIISLHQNLGDIQARCTLAHELGHWHAGDIGCDEYHGKEERKADFYAARMLISRAEYQMCEDMYGCDLPTLAHHLKVTVHTVKKWREWWTTSGQFTTAA